MILNQRLVPQLPLLSVEEYILLKFITPWVGDMKFNITGHFCLFQLLNMKSSYPLLEPVPDYVKDAVNTVMKIHQSEKKGDVLVFLTGQDEVDTAVSLLLEHADHQQSKTAREQFFLSFCKSNLIN